MKNKVWVFTVKDANPQQVLTTGKTFREAFAKVEAYLTTVFKYSSWVEAWMVRADIRQWPLDWLEKTVGTIPSLTTVSPGDVSRRRKSMEPGRDMTAVTK